MAVEATKVANRDLYDVTYDNASGEGLIEASFENPESGDISSYTGKNDGTFVVTVATGYSGTAHCTVSDAAGHLVDEGDVVFGDGDEPHVEHREG
jgi:hypothetical protein